MSVRGRARSTALHTHTHNKHFADRLHGCTRTSVAVKCGGVSPHSATMSQLLLAALLLCGLEDVFAHDHTPRTTAAEEGKTAREREGCACVVTHNNKNLERCLCVASMHWRLPIYLRCREIYLLVFFFSQNRRIYQCRIIFFVIYIFF